MRRAFLAAPLVLLAFVAGCAAPAAEQGLIEDEPAELTVVDRAVPYWVHLRVKNVGDESFTFYVSDLRIVDANGKVKQFSVADSPPPFSSEPKFPWSIELRPGESTEGRLSFGDYEGVSPYVVKYNAFDASGQVVVPP